MHAYYPLSPRLEIIRWDDVEPPLLQHGDGSPTPAGHRVATLDLRGHGESSTGWPDHSETAVAEDMIALVEHLGPGSRAVLVGSSYSGLDTGLRHSTAAGARADAPAAPAAG